MSKSSSSSGSFSFRIVVPATIVERREGEEWVKVEKEKDGESCQEKSVRTM